MGDQHLAEYTDAAMPHEPLNRGRDAGYRHSPHRSRRALLPQPKEHDRAPKLVEKPLR